MESYVIDLKVELEKTKALLNSQKLEEKKCISKLKIKSQESSVTKSKDSPQSQNDDEINILEKSRSILEKKSALYDQIKNGRDVLEDDELNDKFLINFQKKSEESVSQKEEYHKIKELKMEKSLVDENWVEYVDPLGRTRKCLREDLEYMMQRDREMMPEPPKPDAVSLQTAKLHEKWNKIEEDSKDKRDLHYQDILFNEARQHGVGFMPFSRNEAERKSQREMLDKLREESKDAALASKVARKEANKRMADRLVKVRQRKRLKLGLPIKDLYEEKLATHSSSEDETPSGPPPESTGFSVPPEPKSVREWDVGKTTSVMDQRQWVESRRKLRQNEFAPPQKYSGK